MAFLPAFIEIEKVSTIDVLFVIAVAMVSLTIAKLGYVFLVLSGYRWWGRATVGGDTKQQADQPRLAKKVQQTIQQVAALILFVVGAYLPIAVHFLPD